VKINRVQRCNVFMYHLTCLEYVLPLNIVICSFAMPWDLLYLDTVRPVNLMSSLPSVFVF